MTRPAIITPDLGAHNADLARSAERLRKARAYRDCSTVIICPSRGSIPCRVVGSWLGLMRPMNQKVLGPLFAVGMEVGDAYASLFDLVLGHPELSKWKYVLTVEEDNILPPDALLKLIEDIESGPRWDAVGALYWTKGPGGQPMCYGDPRVMPRNFIPFMPAPDAVTPCNGLGMGCTLFRLESLKHPELPRPLFRTVQEYKPGQGSRGSTQDLAYFEAAGRIGQRFACSTRALVGHLDVAEDRVW